MTTSSTKKKSKAKSKTPETAKTTSTKVVVVTDPGQVKISQHDQSHIRDLEIDTINAIQEDGSSSRRPNWNLQKAFQLGFTAVPRGEAEYQRHGGPPDFVQKWEKDEKIHEHALVEQNFTPGVRAIRLPVVHDGKLYFIDISYQGMSGDSLAK